MRPQTCEHEAPSAGHRASARVITIVCCCRGLLRPGWRWRQRRRRRRRGMGTVAGRRDWYANSPHRSGLDRSGHAKPLSPPQFSSAAAAAAVVHQSSTTTHKSRRACAKTRALFRLSAGLAWPASRTNGPKGWGGANATDGPNRGVRRGRSAGRGDGKIWDSSPNREQAAAAAAASAGAGRAERRRVVPYRKS